MGTQRGVLPTKEELAQWITTHSEIQLASWPGYAVSYDYYKRNKPADWRTQQSVLYAYGYVNSVDGWRQFVHDLTGLHCPTRTEIGVMRRGKALDVGVYTKTVSETDVPNESIEKSQRTPHEHLSTMGVLHCRPVQCAKKEWDYRRKVYATVGTYEALMVV